MKLDEVENWIFMLHGELNQKGNSVSWYGQYWEQNEVSKTQCTLGSIYEIKDEIRVG